jgi:hypothetical protein
MEVFIVERVDRSTYGVTRYIRAGYLDRDKAHEFANDQIAAAKVDPHRSTKVDYQVTRLTLEDA